MVATLEKFEGYSFLAGIEVDLQIIAMELLQNAVNHGSFPIVLRTIGNVVEVTDCGSGCNFDLDELRNMDFFSDEERGRGMAIVLSLADIETIKTKVSFTVRATLRG